MHLELRHLRTIRAIHDEGGLARAAEALHITQSALSHQLKALEEQAGVELVNRRAKPLRLSDAGLRLFDLAQQVLPMVATTEAEFTGIEDGRVGRLHLALDCPASFDWLLPVLDRFRRVWRDVDIDIRTRLTTDALSALEREEIDLVIGAEPRPLTGISFQPLFDYAPMLAVPATHPLAGRDFARPQDLAPETLLTYPLPQDRLDAFTHFLTPAGVTPARRREVELTEVMLLLVASGRGVAVLPDWVLRPHLANPELRLLPLGRGGVRRRLFAALRSDDLQRPAMAHLLRQARGAPAGGLR